MNLPNHYEALHFIFTRTTNTLHYLFMLNLVKNKKRAFYNQISQLDPAN